MEYARICSGSGRITPSPCRRWVQIRSPEVTIHSAATRPSDLPPSAAASSYEHPLHSRPNAIGCSARDVSSATAHVGALPRCNANVCFLTVPAIDVQAGTYGVFREAQVHPGNCATTRWTRRSVDVGQHEVVHCMELGCLDARVCGTAQGRLGMTSSARNRSKRSRKERWLSCVSRNPASRLFVMSA